MVGSLSIRSFSLERTTLVTVTAVCLREKSAIRIAVILKLNREIGNEIGGSRADDSND